MRGIRSLWTRAREELGGPDALRHNRVALPEPPMRSKPDPSSSTPYTRWTPAQVSEQLNRAVDFHRRGALEAAQVLYDGILKAEPKHADALNLSGAIAAQTGRLQYAMRLFDRAIAVNPRLAFAHYNRGSALRELYRFTDAVASYDRAIALKADYADAHTGRGGILQYLKQIDAALASHDRAIAIDPESARARLARAGTRLLSGDYAKGWVDYEWRWRAGSQLFGRRRDFAEPLWLGGEDIARKTVLLYCEQAFGDAIQFCRYATLVAARGAQVILEAPAALTGLFSSLEGVAQVLSQDDAPPQFDYHCPLMSLPLALGTTLSTIPAPVPYLKCSDDHAAQWGRRLGERRALRVGLAWSGGSRTNHPEGITLNRRRNIPLARLAALNHREIEFFSLQKGREAELELARATESGWGGPKLHDFSSQLGDFSDTAGLMTHLDLIITVDTSIAHLGGALGKPVWILNRFDTDWRWLLERNDSPWYPTVRLYRQEKPGEWGGVLKRVRADLLASLTA